ncbi:MAG: peptidoglycan D,D-transpeptidase FtsI family protein [Alphaproteobacteria bacterium]
MRLHRARNKPTARQSQPLRAGVDLRHNGGRTNEIPASRSVEMGRTRLLVAGIVFAVGFMAVAGRLVDAMVIGPAMVEAREPSAAVVATATREDIVDRNGLLLATSVVTKSLYANPSEILNVETATARLLSVLPDLNADAIRARLSLDRQFIWLERNLTPAQFLAVHRLGVPGFYFLDEPRRIYPQGSLTAHVVGFTDVDGHGLSGVEQTFDEFLLSGQGPLRLSIDLRVQHILREELARGADEFSAIGASGVVMDVETGEVVAMVSLPDFDPNYPAEADETSRFNRNTLGVYEMGSVFKVFNTAMMLEYGLVNVSSVFDASRPLTIGRFTIRDFFAKHRPLNVAEILVYSSNIGSALMARAAGSERQSAFMQALGMLERSPIELPEVGAPLVPSPWRDINVLTIAFGHGLAVSPLQTVSGYAAVANGGVLVPATIVRQDDPAAIEGRRVISEQVSDIMRRLMRLVVSESYGRANADGYLVGGKTGTAEKAAGRAGYDRNARLSSFIGVFPMTAPRYVVLATLDEPQGNQSTHGYATGGWVSAPIVSRVVSRIGPMLGVMPVDEESAETAAAMQMAVAIQ